MMFLALACTACADRQPDGRKLDVITPNPAPTPAEACIRSMEAAARGDEVAYRRVVVFRPPAARAEAMIRGMLAAARLHHAVRKHGVTGKRVRDAGFDRNEELLVHEPPSPEELAQARQAIAKLDWQIEGNTARPANQPPSASANSLGDVSAERVDGGWVVVITDPADKAMAEYLAESAERNVVTTAAIEAAIAAVESGRFRTIRQVNDFITSERDAFAERKLAEFKAQPPSGPVVVITDAETGQPIAGAKVSAKFSVGGRVKHLDVTTDSEGRARLQGKPDDTIHDFGFTAPGYSPRPAKVSSRPGAGGAPHDVHIALGKPAIVEVMLELPDDRRAAISVYEGGGHDPAPQDVREPIHGKKVRLPVAWEEPPPQLPKHNPMLRLQLPWATGHTEDGVLHRVTHARTAAGRELPVYRDAPPDDEKTFGVYEIGRNGFGDTVFVIGTLADARAVATSPDHFQWSPNTRVVGPASKPTTQQSRPD